ncbi:hypothetical protein JOY44_19820 [Phormidium sp. CLA17]|uniref:hypothetical protein n=1 Tax=Leptolyngbya sp. Cla-17 TaxID=2803751 RepID=UPI001491D0B5|nr:hypothetical protein [Leptolyngbya sp. Cla-17]MBM0743839.1 hypothetical protein [Leptolyngbya sp. Cla-17]
MNQFLRLLLLSPATFASVMSLVMVQPAQANKSDWVQVSKETTCLRAATLTATKFTCKRLASDTAKVFDITQSPLGVKEIAEIDDVTATSFDMTEEESDATVALFGCDCPACVRSLRQLRNMLS